MSMDTINRDNLETKKLKIGFIGQGFVGKNQADDFERRGYETIRYSLEEPFIRNADLIRDCQVVFIATPTPTTPEGFDYTTIEEALLKVGSGKIAVIKSTVLPGVTESLQEKNPQIIVVHAPEFLSEVTAARDSAFPDRNIVGVPQKTDAHMKAAKLLLEILPSAPYNKICSSKEAELIKYGRNTMGYVRIVFVNILYELAGNLGADWAVIQEAMSADPENGPTYMNPVHKSGRGAGGHCFIKDFAALRQFSEGKLQDQDSLNVFKYIEKKNYELLRKSEKDLDLLKGVYGENPNL
jgi:nucleotide sugar dehydrogenase